MDAATASRLRSAAVCAGIGALFKVASTLVERRRLALSARDVTGDDAAKVANAVKASLRHRSHRCKPL